jgi:hypothetical protein
VTFLTYFLSLLVKEKDEKDSDVGDLVNSIGEVGLLQPIVVTPDNTIISGQRNPYHEQI